MSMEQSLSPHFLVPHENSKIWVTWLSIAQFVYFLREMCLLLNFLMIKFTIMFCLLWLYILTFKNWKVNTLPSRKYTNWAKIIHFSLNLREGEEKKTNKYFAPKSTLKHICGMDSAYCLEWWVVKFLFKGYKIR